MTKRIGKGRDHKKKRIKKNGYSDIVTDIGTVAILRAGES
jgi:hypothetical protein